MSQKNKSKIFVYGTLLKGLPLHNYLAKSAARYVGKGRIKGRLYDLGEYPGVVESQNADNVQGEVYELSDKKTLDELDRVEEYHPHFPQKSLFVRRKAIVRLDNGDTIPAWTYFLARKPRNAEIIESGDYRKAVSSGSG